MSEEKRNPIPITHPTLRKIIDSDSAQYTIMAGRQASGGLDPARGRAITGEKADRMLAEKQKELRNAEVLDSVETFNRGEIKTHKPTGKKVTVMKAEGEKCIVIFNRSGNQKKVLKSNLE